MNVLLQFKTITAANGLVFGLLTTIIMSFKSILLACQLSKRLKLLFSPKIPEEQSEAQQIFYTFPLIDQATVRTLLSI